LNKNKGIFTEGSNKDPCFGGSNLSEFSDDKESVIQVLGLPQFL